MNNFENNNYMAIHKQLLKQNSNSKVDTERKCLVQTYSASLQSLSNESSLELLKTNLDKLSDNFTIPKLADVAASQKNLEWHSNLHSVDINSFLQPLPCSSNFNCQKLNNVSDDTYQTICGNFVTKPESNVHKTRGLAEGFSPVPRVSLNNSESTNVVKEASNFKTAFEELKEQNNKKFGTQNQVGGGGQKRRLGMRGSVRNKFVSPMLSNKESSGSEDILPRNTSNELDKVVDDRLKNIEPKMVELIRSEIMDCGAPVHWDDIAGLEFAKTAIQEAVVWPLLRPDIFTGLRRPPKGILLFGPPGTGKTLIGKCVASQSKSTFFSISASSLTSKWIGDGEKMVRALFAVARCHQPAVIFIDEIDSLLSQRSETEHESSRRIKTEFLVQLDGATTDNDERLLVIGATNRPQELDEAARRRFVKRLYIPLPEFEARLQLVTRLMEPERRNLSNDNFKEVAQLSEGYSGADMKNLCSEASLGPIRSIDLSKIQSIQPDEVRPIDMNDFNKALNRVKASVSSRDLDQYIVWNGTYGSGV